MKTYLFLLTLILGASPSRAAVLQHIPGPDATGGMLMPYVTLHFGPDDTGSITIEMRDQGGKDTATLYPLQAYVVDGGHPFADAYFNPGFGSTDPRPWYPLLDPTGSHLPFSTQFGFMIWDTDLARIDLNRYIYIRALSISEGLSGYDVGFWEDVWDMEGNPLPDNEEARKWLHLFDADGTKTIGYTDITPGFPLLPNTVIWGDRNGASMWHPVFIAEGPGHYSATFEIYLGDSLGYKIEGWESGTIQLHWEAIPEPSTVAFALGGCALLLAGSMRRRRNRP